MDLGEEGSQRFEVAPFVEEDLQGISELITRMDSAAGVQRLRDKSADYYRWMYLDNPAGAAVVHCARLGSDIVASFAVAPKIFQIDGRSRVFGKTMDMFTDPRHQGKGLIKRCTQAVFDGAVTAGIMDWYVTPSVNSYPIFTTRWGYREDLALLYRFRILSFGSALGSLRRFARPAGFVGRIMDAITKHDRGLRLPDGWTLDTMAACGEEVDDLWGEVAGGYRVAQVRDSTYLNWRYVQNPDDYTILGLRRAGRLVGLVVLTATTRRGIEVGEIADLVCAIDDDTTLGLLVDAALSPSRGAGHAVLQAWSIGGTRYDARLRRAGLPLRRAGVKFLVSPNIADPAVHDPEAWLLTQGDGNDV